MKIRKYQKSIAIFLLLNFLNYIFTPVLIHAGSVTADEYDSFMPAGTTDMVSTQTGDFHYDVPLFDVPSPEGSYPIHLFYEAGIKNDKNATWTGLGWNLNVGAITRNVNDIPDDFNGQGYVFTDAINPTVTTDTSYPAAISSGCAISNQDAGHALYHPFKATATILTQYGVLHANNASNDRASAAATFDCHALNSEDETNQYTIPNTPEVLHGGSLPSYDQYNVTGEGLSGQIEPMILENGTLFRSSFQSSLSAPYSAIRSYPNVKNFSQSKQFFRFKNEFSNSFIASSNAFTFYDDPNTHGDDAIPTLALGSNNLAYTYTLQDAIGFNSGNMRLAGGKHVDYFTNSEITSGTAKSSGFLDYPYYILDNGGYASSSSERKAITCSSVQYDVSQRIGGYSITTEEGMTYHYALPAYTYGNTVTKKISTASGVYASRTESNLSPYAYSWLLTTVTGSDYIDQNNNGYADEGDLGKWTNFNYGKASSNYSHKSPYSTTTGYYEYSGGMQLSKAGSMELYFLDAVYTRSHTAIFNKSFRSDALDASGASTAYKLNSAILFHSDGIKAISTGMSWTYSNLYTALKNIKAANSGYNSSAITVEDINTISGTSATNYASQILKESKLTYDYSLCKHAINSSSGNGKLTLLSVRNYGKSNSPLAPSTSFQYELSNPKTASVSITSVPSNVAISKAGTMNVSTTPNPFSEGDIISFSISSVTYYAALTQATSSSSFSVMFLGSTVPGSGQLNTSATATQTKNPDYSYYIDNTSKYISTFNDQWGYFKCDVSLDKDYNKDLKTSYASSKAVDCWSLRKITTSFGSTIEVSYESDSYYASQLTQGEILNINQRFKYTDNLTHAFRTDSASVLQCSKLDTAGELEFSFQEDIKEKFLDSQIVQIATLGTISSYMGGSYTSFGIDSFQISTIDESNRKIRGKFVGDPDSRENPMNHCYLSDTNVIFYNNSSFLFQPNPAISYGGGLRVSSISIKEGNGEIYSTAYSYTNRYTNVSSGTVPFIPIIEEPVYISPVDGKFHTDPSIPGKQYQDGNFDTNPYSIIPHFSQMSISYQTAASRIGIKGLANVDFIGSFVLYEFVTVSHTGNGNTYLKSEEYNYQPYTWNMIQRVKQNVLYKTDLSGRFWTTVKLTISDYTSAVGQLLNYSEYDASGNMVSNTNYSYTSSPPLNQGRLDQVFHEERQFEVVGYSSMEKLGLCIVTVKSDYPSVISRVTTTDYLKNSTSFKDFYKFDFYSGNPTETVTKNSEGDYFKQKQVPAYTKSQYAGMGLKFSSSANKNMISPSTASYTYKVNSSNYATHIDTVACSVNTWSNSWSKRAFADAHSVYYDSTISADNSGTVQDDRIWRPRCSYVWKSPLLNSNGSYKNFVDFNWSGTPNSNWQRADSVSKYDQFSNVIEKVDINGNYTSAKYGYDFNFPLTSSDNANFNELAYSGAEDLNSSGLYGNPSYFGSEITPGGIGRQDTTVRHSGLNSLKLTTNQWGLIYQAKISSGSIALDKAYRATVWIYDNGNTTASLYYLLLDPSGNNVTTPNEGSVNIASMTMTPVIAGKWRQLTIDFTLTGSYSNYYLAVGCNNFSSIPAYFDDLRFHPLSETVSANVYDKTTGLVTHSLDENNFYSRRAYDNMFRPVGDYKETIYGEIKIKEYQYNYGKRQ